MAPRFADRTIFGDIHVRLYPGSIMADPIVCFGGRVEFDQIAFVERYLRSGDRAIDVGANIGVYSLLMAREVGTLNILARER